MEFVDVNVSGLFPPLSPAFIGISSGIKSELRVFHVVDTLNIAPHVGSSSASLQTEWPPMRLPSLMAFSVSSSAMYNSKAATMAVYVIGRK